MLTLGYVGASTPVMQRRMAELTALVGRLAHIDVQACPFETYEGLANAVFHGDVDLAWLPPISFLGLLAKQAVVPLASVRRVPYQSAIVVAPESPLQKPSSLVGQRAAWVDPHSAAGFVIPRIKLSRFGIDLRGAFTEERFYGSHEGVVAAVATGAADFGATWANPGSRGAVSGPWTRSPHEVRVLATFGSIPPDVVAARVDLGQPTRKAVVAALKHIKDEAQHRWLVGHVMGTKAFYRPRLEPYGPLQDAVVEALGAGLLGTFDVRKTVADAAEARAGAPRAPALTIPDAVDVPEAEGTTLEVGPDDNPAWQLEEIEIDVTFD